MTYIRVIFKGSAYGPINVPAKMGEIVTAMRVSPRAIPCLVKLDVNNGQHLRRETAAILDKSAGGLHYDINPASSVSSSSTSLTENSKQFKDTPAIVISQMQENVREGLYELVVAHDDLIEMDGDDEDNFQSAREAAAAGHDASKRQWKPSKVAAVQTDNFTTDEWNPHRHQQQQQQQQRYFSLEGREELTDTDLPMSIKEMEVITYIYVCVLCILY